MSAAKINISVIFIAALASAVAACDTNEEFAKLANSSEARERFRKGVTEIIVTNRDKSTRQVLGQIERLKATMKQELLQQAAEVCDAPYLR